jgi:uncharacterized membrane protein YqjE
MARSGTPQSDQSLGDLVAQAAKDLSQLIHYEIDLAKSELRVDVKRLALAAGLAGFCALAGCLIVILLCVAYAYFLHWAGAWGGMGGAFGFTALTIFVLAAVAGFIAYRRVRGMTRLRQTRKTVADDLSMLRRMDSANSGSAAVDSGLAGVDSVAAGVDSVAAGVDSVAAGVAELPGKTSR